MTCRTGVVVAVADVVGVEFDSLKHLSGCSTSNITIELLSNLT